MSTRVKKDKQETTTKCGGAVVVSAALPEDVREEGEVGGEANGPTSAFHHLYNSAQTPGLRSCWQSPLERSARS